MQIFHKYLRFNKKKNEIGIFFNNCVTIFYLLSNIKIYIYIDYNIAKIKNLFDLY